MAKKLTIDKEDARFIIHSLTSMLDMAGEEYIEIDIISSKKNTSVKMYYMDTVDYGGGIEIDDA